MRSFNRFLNKYLARSTSSTSFIPEIDGLRFFSIITVLIFHLNTALSRDYGMTDLAASQLGGNEMMLAPGWWISRLDLGVKVFFAISGVVLALPFLKHMLMGGRKISLSSYYFRRLTRLEPPFIISMLVFALVHQVLLQTENIPTHLFIGLAYAHVPVFGTANPINPVTWSLETEAQFYLIVPALFFILTILKVDRVRITLLLLLIVASVIFRSHALQMRWDQLSNSVFVYFSCFGTGIGFAWLYLKRPAWIRSKSLIWDLIGLIGIIGLFLFYKPQDSNWNGLLFNTSIFLLFLGAFKGQILNGFFTLVPVYIIGGMCYSIYLLHYAFLHLWVPITSGIQSGAGYLPDLLIQLIIGIPVVLLVSALFFVLFEKPFMNKNWPQQLSAFFKRK